MKLILNNSNLVFTRLLRNLQAENILNGYIFNFSGSKVMASASFKTEVFPIPAGATKLILNGTTQDNLGCSLLKNVSINASNPSESTFDNVATNFAIEGEKDSDNNYHLSGYEVNLSEYPNATHLAWSTAKATSVSVAAIL